MEKKLELRKFFNCKIIVYLHKGEIIKIYKNDTEVGMQISERQIYGSNQTEETVLQ